jgi:aminoglycoside phosphotransferase (APT) family kinase protein
VRSLRLLAEGWDNAVWVANERYAFRFPRRRIAIPGVELELELLPKLAPLLPLPVPDPVFRGRPADWYPWPFFGSELLPGRETCDTELADDARLEIALQVARFLRALHALDLDEPLPLDANARADMTVRVPLAREQLTALERLGVWRAPPLVERLLDTAERLSPTELPAVVHGDLHFRHVLVEGRRVTGVIDWGDLCRSDPAIDLPLLWGFVPPEGRAAFLDVYGPVEEEQLLRARVLAFSVWAALAAYAHTEGFPSVEREALGGLERALIA